MATVNKEDQNVANSSGTGTTNQPQFVRIRAGRTEASDVDPAAKRSGSRRNKN